MLIKTNNSTLMNFAISDKHFFSFFDHFLASGFWYKHLLQGLWDSASSIDFIEVHAAKKQENNKHSAQMLMQDNYFV